MPCYRADIVQHLYVKADNFQDAHNEAFIDVSKFKYELVLPNPEDLVKEGICPDCCGALDINDRCPECH